jgi:hypothetical protein
MFKAKIEDGDLIIRQSDVYQCSDIDVRFTVEGVNGKRRSGNSAAGSVLFPKFGNGECTITRRAQFGDEVKRDTVVLGAPESKPKPKKHVKEAKAEVAEAAPKHKPRRATKSK